MTTVYEALAAVMADVASVRKTDRNDAQRFMFRGIDSVLNAVGPALRRHRVIVSPRVDSYEYTTVDIGSGDRRRQMGHARVLVTYTFHGPEGDSVPAQAPGEAFDAGDKATPKAMSVAFRTALLQALALPTDEPDPDTHSYERAAPKPPTAAPSAASADRPSAAELVAAARDAATTDDLTTIARAAVAGHLTGDELAAVRDVVTARRAELQQTGEAK